MSIPTHGAEYEKGLAQCKDPECQTTRPAWALTEGICNDDWHERKDSKEPKRDRFGGHRKADP